MAKNRQHDPLARLVRQGDDAVRSVSALLRETFALISDRVERCRKTLNLAGSASDREKVFNTVRQEMRRASAKIDVILQAQRKRAAKAAAEAAEDMTGLQVKYSEKRAKAICELVTPAQGENLAAVFTDKMGEHYVNTLREAAVQVIREQAVAGGSMKDASRELLERWKERSRDASPKFVDVSGRTWDTGAYLQMNVRTNSMRVYNDCLVDNVARATGSDIMRISDGGDPGCHCAAWEGVIVSISGKTKVFPSYAEARAAGVFHPNCTHTLEYVNETWDEDEIEAQRRHPVDHKLTDDHDAMDERKYRIDQERYRMKGLCAKAARTAVDRDNIDAAIRNGLGKDIREEVDRLTDAQVERLVKDGHPPKFEPLKLTKRERSKMKPADIEKLERWNHGSAGGVVHIDREGLTAGKLVKVCKLDEDEQPKAPPLKAEKRSVEPGRQEPTKPNTLHGWTNEALETARNENDRLVEDLTKKSPTGKGKAWKNRVVTIGLITDEILKDVVKANDKIDPRISVFIVSTEQHDHTIKHHGDQEKETRRDPQQIAITDEDLKLVPDVLASYDDIIKGDGIAEGKKQEAVRFLKTQKDGTLVCVMHDVFNKKMQKRVLSFHTMYKWAKN